MNKMLILLEQLHLTDKVTQLKTATMDKVVVNKDNSYMFYISAPQMISLDEIKLLFSAKDEFPYPCDFTFDWLSSYSSENVKEYALFIFENMKKRYLNI